jgi:hypothetical protein
VRRRSDRGTVWSVHAGLHGGGEYLFRTARRKTGQLTTNPLFQQDAHRIIRRRGRVMEKMGATSAAELVILAQKAGIAPASADATKV